MVAVIVVAVSLSAGASRNSGPKGVSRELPDICGLYRLVGGDACVEVYFYDERCWQARAVWSREYGTFEGREVVVMRDLRYDAAEGVWQGEICDPIHHKSYRATVTRQSDGSLRVTGRKGLLRLSMVWVRVVPE